VAQWPLLQYGLGDIQDQLKNKNAERKPAKR